jgi:hypothetical protein
MNTVTKEENFLQKDKRLKSRKQVWIETYKRGAFIEFQDKENLPKWLLQKDIVIRLNKAGKMDDGTEFINITIEGITPIKH